MHNYDSEFGDGVLLYLIPIESAELFIQGVTSTKKVRASWKYMSSFVLILHACKDAVATVAIYTCT